MSEETKPAGASGSLRLALELEYQGSAFSGFQRQDADVSVQSALEDAIATFLRQQAKKNDINPDELDLRAVIGSGRTDAGVHARGQVATMHIPELLAPWFQSEWDLERCRRALDGITPHELSIKSLRVVPDDFDPRRRVLKKQYRYSFVVRHGSPGLSRGRAWWLRPPLDIAAMISAARYFVGEHDFQSFRASDCVSENSVRKILLSEFVRVGDEEFVYLIQGRGFLKQMVRIIVGTLVEIGQGQRSVDSLPEIFEARNRLAAGRTAPAHGLCLDWVKY